MLGRCPDALQATDLGDDNYFAYLTVDRQDDYHARAIAEVAETSNRRPTNRGADARWRYAPPKASA